MEIAEEKGFPAIANFERLYKSEAHELCVNGKCIESEAADIPEKI